MISQEEFGRNVRAMQKRRGWTQARLGKEAGLWQTEISHIELGKRGSTLCTAQLVAKALRVTVGELLGEVPMR